MEKDLLRFLLAVFPATDGPPHEAGPAVDHLLIRGYRVPVESAVDDRLHRLLAELQPGAWQPTA